MRRTIVAGNWKMHGTQSLVDEFGRLFGQGSDSARGDVETVLLPPVGYLAQLTSALSGTGISTGAQDLHTEQEGAYTGETSGVMIRELGGSWALAGHSERRRYQGEDDTLIAHKFCAALDAGLCPILCVGEGLEERHAGREVEVVETQLRNALQTIGIDRLGGGCIAYEPVWAIGTGETATPEQAQAMHVAIRGVVASLEAEVAQTIPILYGGSVNENNAQTLFSEPDIDGVLVGGASLKAEQFKLITAAAAV